MMERKIISIIFPAAVTLPQCSHRPEGNTPAHRSVLTVLAGPLTSSAPPTTATAAPAPRSALTGRGKAACRPRCTTGCRRGRWGRTRAHRLTTRTFWTLLAPQHCHQVVTRIFSLAVMTRTLQGGTCTARRGRRRSSIRGRGTRCSPPSMICK